jgi:S1-C subfamily serine protease
VVALGMTLTAASTAPAVVPGIPSDTPPPPWRLAISGTPDPVYGGIRITSVEPGSSVERIGLEVGDVIVEVNGQTVRTGEDLNRAVLGSGGYLRIRLFDCRTRAYVFRGVNLSY